MSTNKTRRMATCWLVGGGGTEGEALPDSTGQASVEERAFAGSWRRLFRREEEGRQAPLRKITAIE